MVKDQETLFKDDNEKAFSLLKQEIERASSLYILGVGSELRRDDAAGWEFIKILEKKASSFKEKRVKLAYGAAAPENFAGDVVNFKPDLLIVFDAVFYPDKSPGDIVVVEKESISGVTFNTHSLPLSIILDFILKGHPCRLLIIGIVPIDTEFGEGVTPVVYKMTNLLAQKVISSLS